MDSVANKPTYQAFGMNLTSNIVFPELLAIRDENAAIDVEIEKKELTDCPFGVQLPDYQFTISGDSLIFHIPETGVFEVQSGRRVIAYTYPQCDDSRVRLYLLGTCMGAILIRRRIVPLHGSAVVIDGKAYAFIGESGAGKSTLAAEFLARGNSLISDDVIPVITDADQPPMIIPAYPQQKLWEESLERFDMTVSDHRPIVSNAKKYAVSVRSKFQTEPVPLAGVIEIVKHDAEFLESVRMSRLEGLHALLSHTYRRQITELLGLRQWHFSAISSIASRIEVRQVRRPAGSFTAQAIADHILNIAQKEVLIRR